MKKINWLNQFLLLSVLLLFASCGDEYYTDDFLRNSDEKLCGYNWREEINYINDYGNPELLIQTLYFDRTGAGYGTGREGFEYYRALAGGGWEKTPYTTKTNKFDWEWIEDYEGIILDYGANDIVYFENVWVREFYLSGKLEGEYVTFYHE